MSTIALLTDFGTSDVFVGVMKGVIRTLAPDAVLVDLTHEIPPGDVPAAALRLWQAMPHLPAGTVFLAVVDPGVGSARRAVAAVTTAFACVGPDNGIFSWMLARHPVHHAVQLADPPSASATFHGRDVFAPAAARLAAGAAVDSLGPRVTDLQRLPSPRLTAEPGAIRGEVLLPDRFGNLLTSIGILSWAQDGLTLDPWIPSLAGARLPARRFRVGSPGRSPVPLARTFSDVPPGSAVAYVGSDGLLEIGVNRGSAAQVLGISRGSEVILSIED